MACDRYEEDLTAWIDGELPLIAAVRLRRHLIGCRACGTAIAQLRQTVALQTELLTRPLAVDSDRLLAVTRTSIAALGTPRSVEPATHVPTFAWGRAAFTGIGVFVLLVGSAVVVSRSVGIQPMLIALGVEAPPPQVVRNAELFREYELIRELEALEHFESVDRVSLDDERAEAARRQFT